MTSGTIVAASQQGPIRAQLVAKDGEMILFSRAERNAIVRAALFDGGEAWRAAFLPKRFTKYVEREPFCYGKRTAGFFAKKLREADGKSGVLSTIFTRICISRFFGWNPWDANQRIPDALIRKWKAENPGMYRNKRGLSVLSKTESKRMYADIRRWAKGVVREYAKNLDADGIILPLVLTGALRKLATGSSRTVPVSTASKQQIKLVIPVADRQADTVNRVLRTLPEWEIAYIAKKVGETLGIILSSPSSRAGKADLRTFKGATMPVRSVPGNVPRSA